MAPPAWLVTVDTYRAVTFAENAAKAKWNAVSSYWDAGFGRGSGAWPPGVSATRAPQYDGCGIEQPGRRVFTEEFIKYVPQSPAPGPEKETP